MTPTTVGPTRTTSRPLRWRQCHGLASTCAYRGTRLPNTHVNVPGRNVDNSSFQHGNSCQEPLGQLHLLQLFPTFWWDHGMDPVTVLGIPLARPCSNVINTNAVSNHTASRTHPSWKMSSCALADKCCPPTNQSEGWTGWQLLRPR